MESQRSRSHSLLWGNSASKENEKEEVAEQLCHHYISQKVSGVFFAPVEFSTGRFRANHRIVEALDNAGIPVVLLDRCLETYPRRSRYDLVGIDNRRTAYQATEHLIAAGAKSIAFIARPNSARYRRRSYCRIQGSDSGFCTNYESRGGEPWGRVGSDIRKSNFEEGSTRCVSLRQ